MSTIRKSHYRFGVFFLSLLFALSAFAQPCREVLSALQKARNTAKSVGLKYVDGFEGEITRKNVGTKKKPKYEYFDDSKGQIRDPKVIERIQALKIPPGYQKVRIASDPKSHIQAVGFDAKNRKQFRYHARWIEARAAEKYASMKDFGAGLDKIRETYDEALRGEELSKERVLAAVIKLVDLSHMRVGGEKYAKENDTFGISSLKKEHVSVRGDRVHLKFTGKSHQEQDIVIEDPDLARILKQLMKLPGKRLFQFETGEKRVAVNETMVNQAFKKMAGDEFSIKDFRTWHGSVTAFRLLSGREVPEDDKQRAIILREAFESVAKELGNTWDVARDNYVHPSIIEAYEAGKLKVKGKIQNIEQRFLDFLGG